MKSSLLSKILTLTVAALLATSALAAGAGHRGTLQTVSPVQVNGKSLPAGEYTVTWSGDGPNVNVSFARGGKVLATAAATVVTLDQKAPSDVCELKTSSTGSQELSALRFSGQKVQLDIAAGGDQAKSGDSMK
jgi:hypothetical protein